MSFRNARGHGNTRAQRTFQYVGGRLGDDQRGLAGTVGARRALTAVGERHCVSGRHETDDDADRASGTQAGDLLADVACAAIDERNHSRRIGQQRVGSAARGASEATTADIHHLTGGAAVDGRPVDGCSVGVAARDGGRSRHDERNIFGGWNLRLRNADHLRSHGGRARHVRLVAVIAGGGDNDDTRLHGIG